MNPERKSPKRNLDEEIPALIETLLATEQRLEELTGGEVDTVAGRDGRTFLLRRAQEELRFSEAAKQAALLSELRVLFDMVPAMIWFKDTENGFLRVNKRGAEMSGRRVEEIEGKSAYEIFPREAAGYYADDLQVIQSGAPKMGIIEKLRGANGQPRWVQTDKVPVLDKDGKVTGLLVMAQDISERKRDEEALRASQVNMAAAQRIAHFGSWELELNSSTDINANVLRWSDEMFRIAGYEPGGVEVSNELFFRLVHPEDRESVRQAVETAIRERREYSVVHRLIRADGETRVVQETAQIFFNETSGLPTRIVGTAHDITEQRKVAEELRESEERFAGAFEHAPIGVALVSPEGRWLKTNQAIRDLFGYSEEELKTHTIVDLTHPDDVERSWENVRRAIAGHFRPLQIEKRYIHKRGNVISALLNISLIRDAAGQPKHFVAQIQDITERKLSETRFRRLVDSNAQGVFFWNKKGEITGGNDAFLKIVGFTRADLEAGRIDWVAMTPPEYAHLDRHALDELTRTGVCQSYEKAWIRKDGSHVPILLGAAMFEDNPEDGVCFVLDITERKHAETLLKHSQKRLRDIIDGVGPSMFVGLLTPQGILIECNRPALAAAGLKPEDVLGKPFDQTPWWSTSPEAQQQLRETIARAALGEASRYDVRTQGRGNQVMDLDFSLQPLRDEAGEVVFLVPSACVITERKQAETALQETQLRLAHAMSMAQLAAWEYDPATGFFTFDDRYYLLLGTTAAQEGGNLMSVGEFARVFIHPGDAGVIRAELGKAMDTTDPGYRTHFECRIFRRDGETRLALVSISITKDAAGRTIRIQGANQDITERKRIEVALRESDERLRAALAASHTGTFRWIFSTNELTWDRSLDALFGLPQGQEVQSLETFVATLHPDDRADVLARCERCARHGADFDMEFRILWPDGSLHWLDDKGKTFFDVTGKPLYMTGACVDITERKQGEMALRASEAEFRALAEAMPQMVWITRADGWNIYFSRQWMDYTGLTLEESLGHGWNKPFHPEDQQRAWDAWQHATATIGIYSVECRLRRADGIYRWWLVRGIPQRDADGTILKWFGTCTDIHDLKSAELEISRTNRELRESDERFRELADNITDVFWITSPDFSTMHYVSAGYERIWGRSAESLYAHPHQWIEMIIPEDRESAFAVFATLRGTASEASVEYRIARPDGTSRWIHDRGYQVRDAAGKLIRITGIASDITIRKLSEAALEKAHKELVETSRRAGMAEVATGILHNVGNVLNSVNVASSCIADSIRKSKAANLGRVVGLLREHEADLSDFLTVNPQGRQIPDYLAQLAEHLVTQQSGALTELGGLQKNIEHIKDIVAMQQGLARVSGVTERLSVVNLVEDALKMNASALARHDILVVREFQSVPLVTVAKHQALQILVNLVRNAQQSCDEANRPEKQLTVRVTPAEIGVRIALADNGIGILPENLARIFAHGFTTKKSGHGFGLHSAALAAKEMGGALIVQSDGFGRGATFTLELPLQPPSQRE